MPARMVIKSTTDTRNTHNKIAHRTTYIIVQFCLPSLSCNCNFVKNEVIRSCAVRTVPCRPPGAGWLYSGPPRPFRKSTVLFGAILAQLYSMDKRPVTTKTVPEPPGHQRRTMGKTTLDNHHTDTRPSTTNGLEVMALYRIAQLIGSALDLDKALAEILRILHDTLRMERATLVLKDSGGARLAIRASYGLIEREKKRGIYKIDEGVIGKVFRTAYPFVVPDIQDEPLFLNRTGARTSFDKGEISFIGVPVVILEKPVGVLSVDRLFGLEISFEEDIRFLTVVATLIAQFLHLHETIAKKEQRLLEENISLKAELKTRFSHKNMIGQCKRMQEVFRYIDKVAPSSATALLLGESGTGKELVSRAIHIASPRHKRPFVKVNCAALPDTLLESELLGHEKGAFTGATATKKGRFEMADGGTLFLDEIGELPMPLQAKLLRVIQEKQFERLGGTRTIDVDVRIIAATNRNLEEELVGNRFREDLFYRLNVVPITIPPLRKRKDDLPMLIDHFLKGSNQNNKRRIRFSRAALALFTEYHWPGNIRELENLIERLVIMNDGEVINLNDLPSYINAPMERQCAGVAAGTTSEEIPTTREGAMGAATSLQDLERHELEAALIRHGWVQARAARELKITQRQIGYKIRKHGLTPPEHLKRSR